MLHAFTKPRNLPATTTLSATRNKQARLLDEWRHSAQWILVQVPKTENNANISMKSKKIRAEAIGEKSSNDIDLQTKNTRYGHSSDRESRTMFRRCQLCECVLKAHTHQYTSSTVNVHTHLRCNSESDYGFFINYLLIQ